jgi:Ni/Co efflux regulator RcnB
MPTFGQKLILGLATAAAVLPLATSMPAAAQSAAEVRHDNREVQQSRQDLRDAQLYGDRRDVRDARQELREDRRERREDWRDYRAAHRDVYRVPVYRRPGGWVERDWRPGLRLPSSYYARPYWVSDYGRYRLSVPPAGYRWVRVDRDVLLIRARDGYIRDVIRQFFW